jgi:hypothetical protein
VQDELNEAKAEFEAAKEEYETAFRASLDHTPAPVEDDGDDDEE